MVGFALAIFPFVWKKSVQVEREQVEEPHLWERFKLGEGVSYCLRLRHAVLCSWDWTEPSISLN
jgi:hypothetical protein